MNTWLFHLINCTSSAMLYSTLYSSRAMRRVGGERPRTPGHVPGPDALHCDRLLPPNLPPPRLRPLLLVSAGARVNRLV